VETTKKKHKKKKMFNEQETINGTYFDSILRITCEKVSQSIFLWRQVQKPNKRARKHNNKKNPNW
jgi:hypothetical protein